jgi:hypothetical protein
VKINEIISGRLKYENIRKVAAFCGSVALHEMLVSCDLSMNDPNFFEPEEKAPGGEFHETLVLLCKKLSVEFTCDDWNLHEMLDTSREIFFKTPWRVCLRATLHMWRIKGIHLWKYSERLVYDRHWL